MNSWLRSQARMVHTCVFCLNRDSLGCEQGCIVWCQPRLCVQSNCHLAHVDSTASSLMASITQQHQRQVLDTHATLVLQEQAASPRRASVCWSQDGLHACLETCSNLREEDLLRDQPVIRVWSFAQQILWEIWGSCQNSRNSTLIFTL